MSWPQVSQMSRGWPGRMVGWASPPVRVRAVPSGVVKVAVTGSGASHVTAGEVGKRRWVVCAHRW